MPFYMAGDFIKLLCPSLVGNQKIFSDIGPNHS